MKTNTYITISVEEEIPDEKMREELDEEGITLDQKIEKFSKKVHDGLIDEYSGPNMDVDVDVEVDVIEELQNT